MRTTLLLFLLLEICLSHAHQNATVVVSPSRSQRFVYEETSFTCDHSGAAEWTVWRYAPDSSDPKLSECGNGWGILASSACMLTAAIAGDTGSYWCQSNQGDSSDAVNITVTSGPVILDCPLQPVTEGQEVTLHCKTTHSHSAAAATFYKDDALIRTEPTGRMVIRNFSKSDESVYKCCIGEKVSHSSWLLMKDDSPPATLAVTPSLSQVFDYQTLAMSCGDNSSLRGWSTIRATGKKMLKLESCVSWGLPAHFGCVITATKQEDSGIYWCQSPTKRRSNFVNITVRDGPVILQSPLLPVTEGENVTLFCKSKTGYSNLNAVFYKDGSPIGTELVDHMTIYGVSVSDEGLYMCNIRGHGESESSWLFVRDPRGRRTPLTSSRSTYVLTVLRHLVVVSPYCISTGLMLSSYYHRSSGGNTPVSTAMPPGSEEDEEQLDEPYDDVIADVTTEHHF